MDISIITTILFAHWIGDFIFQSDYHAKNKSSNNFVLFEHVSIYGFILALAGLIIPISIGWLVTNIIMHFVVDYITSRITSTLWKNGDIHDFFVIVGLDQMLHYLILFLTYIYMVNL